MKKVLTLLVLFFSSAICFAQNVGIGTVTPIESFHVVGNKAYFQTNFFGIGTNTPTTPFTGLVLKNNVNNYYGMYIDAGATGQPFYGYALNGVASAYQQLNGTNGHYEYYHGNSGVPDFQISNIDAAFPNAGFLGIGTTTPTTAFTGLTIKKNVNSFYGMYVDAGATGQPFYGFALNGVASAYQQLNGTNGQYEYYHSNGSVPDFQIGNTSAAFQNSGFLGIGTATPTTGFTGLTLKKNVNTYFGSYVDAGATGIPFYGYALNGTAVAYTTYNGATNQFEYHHTTDATPDFSVSNTAATFPIQTFLGIGTSTPTTGFTGLTMKKNVNTYFGSYVDAGATGIPFYGYALNGTAVAYTTYNGGTNQFEYHHTADATPDFSVSNTQVTFPIQTFLGLGTATPTTGSATGFTMKNNVNSYYGMYIDAGATGQPFYGYALNGAATAWTELNGTTGNWELNYSGARMAVSASGFIGMNTPPNATFRLDVGGNIRCVTLTQTSDIRFKTDIEPLEGSLDKIMNIHGVSWKWKVKEYPEKEFSADKQIGFVAQDLEKTVPELVVTDTEGYKSIDYAKMTALLTEAVKTQQMEIEAQRKENEELKKQVAEIRAELKNLHP